MIILPDRIPWISGVLGPTGWPPETKMRLLCDGGRLPSPITGLKPHRCGIRDLLNEPLDKMPEKLPQDRPTACIVILGESRNPVAQVILHTACLENFRFEIVSKRFEDFTPALPFAQDD